MNRPADHERLFADALADKAPAGFRETLLGETLRHARRRQHWRQTRRGAIALAALTLLVILVRQTVPHHPSALPVTVAGCEIIRTQPLPAGAIVATEPFPPDRLIASVASVNRVQTIAATGDYREIGDDELLALVAPRPVVLVGRGPQSRQLIFINPEDEKGFPVN